MLSRAVRGILSVRTAPRTCDKTVRVPLSGIITTVLSGFAANVYLLIRMSLLFDLIYFDYDWLLVRLILVVAQGGIDKSYARDFMDSMTAVVVTEDVIPWPDPTIDLPV